MSQLFKLEEHLRALIVEYELSYEDGDWDRLNFIGLAIDDTRDQIEALRVSPSTHY